MKKTLSYLGFLYSLSLSCTFTDKVVNTPKMFEGDMEQLKSAFDNIATGVTTWQHLEEAGFDFTDSNVKIFGGAEAMKTIFGQNVFQGAVTSDGVLQTLLNQLDTYKLVVIPHRYLVSKRDRIYFTSKELFASGHDAKFVILFRSNTVVYKTSDIEKVDKYELAKAWGQGFVDFLGLARDATKLPNPKVPALLNGKDQ